MPEKRSARSGAQLMYCVAAFSKYVMAQNHFRANINSVYLPLLLCFIVCALVFEITDGCMGQTSAHNLLFGRANKRELGK